MLLDIPAVADTDGIVQDVTWRSDGIYTYSGVLHIPGVFSAGAFDDDEIVHSPTGGVDAVINGAGQSSGSVLVIDALNGVPLAEGQWSGENSLATFEATGIPYIPYPERFFIYVDEPANEPFIHPQNAQTYVLDGGVVTMGQGKNPRQGSTIKFLTTVAASFTVPFWARSFTIKNVSGALMYFRRFGPNVEANVIDTPAATFGEDYIVGQELADDQVVSFSNGDFTPGSSYIFCAAAAAANGAIVEFYP